MYCSAQLSMFNMESAIEIKSLFIIIIIIIIIIISRGGEGEKRKTTAVSLIVGNAKSYFDRKTQKAPMFHTS